MRAAMDQKKTFLKVRSILIPFWDITVITPDCIWAFTCFYWFVTAGSNTIWSFDICASRKAELKASQFSWTIVLMLRFHRLFFASFTICFFFFCCAAMVAFLNHSGRLLLGNTPIPKPQWPSAIMRISVGDKNGIILLESYLARVYRFYKWSGKRDAPLWLLFSKPTVVDWHDASNKNWREEVTLCGTKLGKKRDAPPMAAFSPGGRQTSFTLWSLFVFFCKNGKDKL